MLKKSLVVFATLLVLIFSMKSTANAQDSQEQEKGQIFLPVVVQSTPGNSSQISVELETFISTNYLGHAASYPDPNESVDTAKLFLDGMELLKSEETGKAISLFAEGVANFPMSRYAHEGLASAYQQRYEFTHDLKDLRQSTSEFLEASRIGMMFGKVRFTDRIATGLATLGSADELDRYFANAIKVATDPYLPKFSYARALAILNDERAEQMIRDAISIEPEGVSDAVIFYAEWLIKQKRYAEVIDLSLVRVHDGEQSNQVPFSVMVIDEVDNPYMYFLRGVALEHLNRKDEASTQYDKYYKSGINSFFPAPEEFQILGSSLQSSILFGNSVKAPTSNSPGAINATDTNATYKLSSLIACEAGGEPDGAKRAVAWVVRTRVFRAYNVSTACGGYGSPNGVWQAIASSNSRADRYMAIMNASGQFCPGGTRTSTTDSVAYNVYIGAWPEQHAWWCPNGSPTGSTCTGYCTLNSYTGAPTTGAAWFYATNSSCPATHPGLGSSCANLSGKTCGNGSYDNCFYRIK